MYQARHEKYFLILKAKEKLASKYTYKITRLDNKTIQFENKTIKKIIDCSFTNIKTSLYLTKLFLTYLRLLIESS